MTFKIKVFVPLLLLSLSLYSQEKNLRAIKIGQPPRIDGDLGDPVWSNAPMATGFTQYYPAAGAAASRETSVKLLYDNTAIYIGAYLYDDPKQIRKQLTARDEEMQKDVDYFAVFFDTYNDNQNGFQFVVTSANVQSDARLGPNLGSGGSFGEFGDKTWDAVWESKVQTHKDGWSVEMRIPYISLRFAKKDLQDWGIQFLRLIRRTNETCYWNKVDPQVNGVVNQFGNLLGLEQLQPPLRLSFSPYVSGGFRSSPDNGTEFTNTWLRSGGMDLKYGINESFTLDATLIPDFGQVISDNVINNLSPFEIRFQENRPFFTEGTELFNKAGLFYSRRVGATPGGYNNVRLLANMYPEWDIIKNPSVTQLYNAAKFSGRTPKKLGIGVFNAVTAPMYARLRNSISGKDSTIETEPLANYNIFVLDQALKGRSSVTFTNTSVVRNAAARDANVSALDLSFFDKTNTYNVKATARYSKIFGANSYDGFNTTLRFAKVSGNWQYNIQGNVESADYDPRDLGFLQAPNEISVNSTFGYYHFQPKGGLLQYNYRINAYYSRMYEPGGYNRSFVRATAFWIFRNFWDVTLTAGYFPTEQDYFVLGNPSTYKRFVKRPSYGYIESSGSSDSRKKLYVRYSTILANFFNSAPNKAYHALEGGLRYRFSNRFTLDFSHRHEGETDYIIFAGREVNNEPIVAFVDFTDITSIVSGIYNFTPRINLTLRGRHYLSRVQFNRFANVDQQGNTLDRAGTTRYDNVNVFNLDAFLTWDFRLGSRLILGYKNWLGNDEIVTPSGKNNYLNNFRGIFDQRHGNEITLRFIYFLDYNQLRRKK